MALNSNKIKGGGVDQQVVDPGVYPSRIVQIIDFGLQPQRPYLGQDKPPANEIGLTYELVDTFMVDKDGKEDVTKPRWLSEIIPLFNLKADKAKSTQRYKAADPNNNFNGDFSKLIETPVNVSVVHNKQGEKLWVNVASISAMRPRDADKCPKLVNLPKVFDLDEPNLEVFRKLPEWMQEKIKKNLNFNGSKLQAALGIEAEEFEEKKPIPANDKEAISDDKPWD